MDKTAEGLVTELSPEVKEVALPESPGNGRVLFLATTAFFFSFAIRALYAPFGPYFKKWYNLSAGQVLILVAIPAYRQYSQADLPYLCTYPSYILAVSLPGLSVPRGSGYG